jgi:hypothetical protein
MYVYESSSLYDEYWTATFIKLDKDNFEFDLNFCDKKNKGDNRYIYPIFKNVQFEQEVKYTNRIINIGYRVNDGEYVVGKMLSGPNFIGEVWSKSQLDKLTNKYKQYN